MDDERVYNKSIRIKQRVITLKWIFQAEFILRTLSRLASFRFAHFNRLYHLNWWVARIACLQWMMVTEETDEYGATNQSSFCLFFQKRKKNCIRHKEKFVMSAIVDIECLITCEKGVLWFLNSFSQPSRLHHTCYLFVQCDFTSLSDLCFSLTLPLLVPSFSFVCISPLCDRPQFLLLQVFGHKISLKCSYISFALRLLSLTPDSLNLPSKNSSHRQAQA